MKKVILMSVLFVSVCCFGETLTFVTTMSAPVGSFAQVETSDKATATTVNLYNVGRINIVTSPQVNLGNVELDHGTLSGNPNEFQAKKLRVSADGKLEGGRLVAKTMTVETNDAIGIVKPTLTFNNQATAGVFGVQEELTITYSDSTRIAQKDQYGAPGNNLIWKANTYAVPNFPAGSSNERLLRSN